MLQAHAFAGPTQFHASGRFFLLQETNAADLGVSSAVEVSADGRNIGTYYPGDSIELENPAGRWEVRPVVPTLAGTVVIGQGSIRSARVSGQVDVIDRSVMRTLQGKQFFGGVQRVAAAGTFCGAGVFADTASFVIRRLSYQTNTAGLVRLLVASGNSLLAPGPSSLRNKIADGSATAATRCWVENFSASPPPPGELVVLNTVATLWAPANDELRIVDSAPIILPAGNSLWLVHGTAAVQASIVVEGEEL